MSGIPTPPFDPFKSLLDQTKLNQVYTPKFDFDKLLGTPPPTASPLSTFNFPKLDLPPIPPNPVVTNIELNYASEFYNRLMTMIGQFEAKLDDQHEVGMRLVSFGESKVFHLDAMGWYNPSLISFAGVDQNGNRVELIQHVTQISMLLIALPKLIPDKPKRRIGFHVDPPDNTVELRYPPQPDHGGTC